MNRDTTAEAVTARIIFKGVMLMCINDDKNCELGMISCPDHDPTITIEKLVSGVQTDEFELPWPADRDLIFKVNQAASDEVVPDSNSAGDASFTKVIDLEGENFHNEKVQVNTALLNGRRLGVTSGKLYTHKLNDDELELLTWTDASDPGTAVNKPLGRTAEEVGLNVVCLDEAGSGIEILDSVTGAVLKTLPRLPDTTYQIVVNNDCSRVGAVDGSEAPPPPNPVEGTDFRFFYDVISSPDGRKFDIRVAVMPTAPPSPFPGVCELGFLSKTNTLGLKWPTF